MHQLISGYVKYLYTSNNQTALHQLINPQVQENFLLQSLSEFYHHDSKNDAAEKSQMHDLLNMQLDCDVRELPIILNQDQQKDYQFHAVMSGIAGNDNLLLKIKKIKKRRAIKLKDKGKRYKKEGHSSRLKSKHLEPVQQYVGVYEDTQCVKQENKYAAYLERPDARVAAKSKRLIGYFGTSEEAAKAVNQNITSKIGAQYLSKKYELNYLKSSVSQQKESLVPPPFKQLFKTTDSLPQAIQQKQSLVPQPYIQLNTTQNSNDLSSYYGSIKGAQAQQQPSTNTTALNSLNYGIQIAHNTNTKLNSYLNLSSYQPQQQQGPMSVINTNQNQQSTPLSTINLYQIQPQPATSYQGQLSLPYFSSVNPGQQLVQPQIKYANIIPQQQNYQNVSQMYSNNSNVIATNHDIMQQGLLMNNQNRGQELQYQQVAQMNNTNKAYPRYG